MLIPPQGIVATGQQQMIVDVTRRGPRGLRFAEYSGNVYVTEAGLVFRYEVEGTSVCGSGRLTLNSVGPGFLLNPQP